MDRKMACQFFVLCLGVLISSMLPTVLYADQVFDRETVIDIEFACISAYFQFQKDYEWEETCHQAHHLLGRPASQAAEAIQLALNSDSDPSLAGTVPLPGEVDQPAAVESMEAADSPAIDEQMPLDRTEAGNTRHQNLVRRLNGSGNHKKKSFFLSRYIMGRAISCRSAIKTG